MKYLDSVAARLYFVHLGPQFIACVVYYQALKNRERDSLGRSCSSTGETLNSQCMGTCKSCATPGVCLRLISLYPYSYSVVSVDRFLGGNSRGKPRTPRRPRLRIVNFRRDRIIEDRGVFVNTCAKKSRNSISYPRHLLEIVHRQAYTYPQATPSAPSRCRSTYTRGARNLGAPRNKTARVSITEAKFLGDHALIG